MKKIIKVVSIMLCVCMLLPFAALGCTDKDDPRRLNDVEKSLIGEWERVGDDAIYVFTDNGECFIRRELAYPTHEFHYNNETGCDDVIDGYYIIRVDNATDLALSWQDPDVLYAYRNNKISTGSTYRRVADGE